MRETRNVSADGVVGLVEGLLRQAISRRVSDAHFEPGEGEMRVRFRIDGLLYDVDRLPGSLAENVIARLKVLAGLLTYRIDIPQEGAFRLDAPPPEDRRVTSPAVSVSGIPLPDPGVPEAEADAPPAAQRSPAPIDIRVATFPTVRGERATVRLLYSVGRVSGLDDLGLPAGAVHKLRQAAERPHGLIVVTGPAGSGKSTTLYALARHILAATPGRSVISLEDPVEQRVAGMAQIQITPHGELNYVRAMRSLLRQDVQVLLVGEIRDAETAHIVVDASLTGHLIMSTLHSGDPAEAVARLLEMGIAPYQLVGALTLVCSQRLLRTICPNCGANREAGVREGCSLCSGTGYQGRAACGQVAGMDERLRAAVLARTPASELRRQIAEGGPDLAADAQRLVESGRTTREEMLRVLGVD